VKQTIVTGSWAEKWNHSNEHSGCTAEDRLVGVGEPGILRELGAKRPDAGEKRPWPRSLCQ
jgi:hypothetical protein